ncbi:MAG: hypothetical protein GY811_08480 [Myxococcales bacterium]|nr:hypothetical protein [Myxococcales bacterium]
MAKLARHLRGVGHSVLLFGYPRRANLADAARKLARFLQQRKLDSGGANLGFVGHSAGGVLLRYLAVELPGFSAGRSVVLGSPISGSVLAQSYAHRPWMKVACGPILASLHPERVAVLPAAPCELAAVAGTARTVFLPASLLMAPLADGRPSDSTVLVEETRAPTMRDWISVPVIHTLLPRDPRVHELVSRYLYTGRFKA